MSGGGGTGGVGPTGPSGDADCGSLAFDTQLASPDASVVADIGSGDQLELDLQVREGGLYVIAALTADDRRFAGAITERTADLVRCIQEGVRYVAVVGEIDGGWVEVHVQPR